VNRLNKLAISTYALYFPVFLSANYVIMQATLNLEGFAETLKGHRLFCVGTKNLATLVRSRMALIDTEVAHRGRKILCVQEGSTQTGWLLRMKWDAIFCIREAQDLRLALTYITNCTKPARVVWGGEPSATVFQALARCDGLTLIGFGATPPRLQEWDTIFWSHDAVYDEIEPCLMARLGALNTGKYNLRSVLKEIQASEVGLAWSNIGDSDKRGSLYWFDPSEGLTGAIYSPQEAVDILRAVADSIGGLRN
jgi:hypothetical protein